MVLVLSSSDEGKVRKVLKVEPLPDGSGRFFNLSKQKLYSSLLLYFRLALLISTVDFS